MPGRGDCLGIYIPIPFLPGTIMTSPMGTPMSMVTTLIPTVARNRVQEQPAILVTVAPIRLGKN